MDRKYFCPFCDAHLNPSAKIVLIAARASRRALVLLSPLPGDYDVILPRGFDLDATDEVTFVCPVCTHSLTSEKDASMAELRFAGNEEGGSVVFSRVYGRHATYVIAEGIVRSFGEHADADGVNFWGERAGT
ncbi:MAG: hypothetical protein MUF54_07530 [Polyangiaceae bacterium]|jgi:hypothetical protein|nr:hypothetical protein [Polyangiaceae bacterium]